MLSFGRNFPFKGRSREAGKGGQRGVSTAQDAARELPLEQIVSEALAALQPTVSPDFEVKGPIVDRLDAIC